MNWDIWSPVFLGVLFMAASLGWVFAIAKKWRVHALEDALREVRVDCEMAREADVAWLDIAIIDIDKVMGEPEEEGDSAR